MALIKFRKLTKIEWDNLLTKDNDTRYTVFNLDGTIYGEFIGNDIIIAGTVDGEIIQEVIEARQGEVTLGANITKVKSQLAQTERELYGKLPANKYDSKASFSNPSDIVGMDSNQNIFRVSPSDNAKLEISEDGEVWEHVYTFNSSVLGVRELDNGEILVGVSSYGISKVFLSNGYPEGQPDFEEVLTAPHLQQNFSLSWGFGGGEGKYVIAPYDVKPSNQRSESQPVYLTEDFGKTWSKIYEHGTGSLSNRHVHGVLYDKYRNAIWVTLGDYTGDSTTGGRSIIVSWDMGNTWQTVSDKHQPTTIVAFPNCVIFGQDSVPNGVLRINNPTPTHLKLDVAYKINNSNLLTHVAEAPYQLSQKDPVIIPFGTTTNGEKSLVLATFDGNSFFEIWADEEPTALTSMGRTIGPTKNGDYLISGHRNNELFNVRVKDFETSLMTTTNIVGNQIATQRNEIVYMQVANSSSPYDTITGGAWTPIHFNERPFAWIKDDPSELFTVYNDRVEVNRDCYAMLSAIVPYGWGAISPSVSILINGVAWVNSFEQNSIATNFSLNKGDIIKIETFHKDNGNDITLHGSSNTLTIIAFEQ